jgi:hypothetical protein
MSRQIKSYNDLCKEKQRLETLLLQQKAEFRSNLQDFKEDYTPLIKLGSAIGMLTTRNFRYPLLNLIAGMVINSLVKNKLLASAGWVTRLLVPFFMKNVSSHVIKRKAVKLFAKFRELVQQN